MGEVHQANALTLVALPYVSKDGFSGPTVRSLLEAVASGKFGRFSVMFVGDKTQVMARNDACRKAIEISADYIFFVDSDQDFPADTLSRLKAVDADVACADMWARTVPSYRLVFEPEKTGERFEPVKDDVTDGIRDIGYCGMGCTLIRTSIVRRMEKKFPDQPWFWAAHNGEDATFCFKVRDMGGTVQCDFGIKSGHWNGSIRMMGQPFTRERNIE